MMCIAAYRITIIGSHGQSGLLSILEAEKRASGFLIGAPGSWYLLDRQDCERGQGRTSNSDIDALDINWVSGQLCRGRGDE